MRRLAVLTVLSVAIAEAVYGQQADSRSSVVAHAVNDVCTDDIVLLGELPSHGEAQAFQIKAGIVQGLVERCGFSALLFEAPIYDFIGFQQAVTAGGAVSVQLDHAIGRFWLTRELRAFRAWLFERAASRRLTLGGLDDQVSVTSQYARETLPALIAAASPTEKAAACEQTVARNLNWSYDAGHPFEELERQRLQQCTRTAAAGWLGVGATERAMLTNLASYVDRQVSRPQARDRDEVMYENVLWHIERLPKRAKVIVWTATVHAARMQGALTTQPLGARLVARAQDRVAAIGFTAHAGHSSMAGRASVPFAEAPPGSLEARATDGGIAWHYLDSATLHRMGAVPSRLFGAFAAADWAQYFDGVVVIREEVAPSFEEIR